MYEREKKVRSCQTKERKKESLKTFKKSTKSKEGGNPIYQMKPEKERKENGKKNETKVDNILFMETIKD